MNDVYFSRAYNTSISERNPSSRPLVYPWEWNSCFGFPRHNRRCRPFELPARRRLMRFRVPVAAHGVLVAVFGRTEFGPVRKVFAPVRSERNENIKIKGEVLEKELTILCINIKNNIYIHTHAHLYIHI